jgi:hypothetical protein
MVVEAETAHAAFSNTGKESRYAEGIEQPTGKMQTVYLLEAMLLLEEQDIL